MKKLILLSLMFGGMGIVDAYASAKSVVVDLNNNDIKQWMKSLGFGDDDRDRGVFRALYRAYQVAKDPLLYVGNEKIEKVECPRIKIGSYYTDNNTQKMSNLPPSGFKDYSKNLAEAALSVIKGLLKKYGIQIPDDNLGTECDKQNKTLLSKLYLFYNAHSRQHITINPIIKIRSKGAAWLSKKASWWTGYASGYARGKVGTLYVYNNAHNGKTLGLLETGEGTGDISFVLVKDEDNFKNLKYRIYKSSSNDVDEAVKQAKNFLGDGNALISHFNDIYKLAVLNEIGNKKSGNGFGAKVYDPKYIDYLGAYNTTIGDYLFKEVTNASDHSRPVYFYHKKLNDGNHLIGFYIMKKSLKGWRELQKGIHLKKEWGYRAFGSATEVLEDRDNGMKKGDTVVKHWKNRLLNKHTSNYSALFEGIEGENISTSKTKGMAFYIMQISDSVYKGIISSGGYKQGLINATENTSQQKWKEETEKYDAENKYREGKKVEDDEDLPVERLRQRKNSSAQPLLRQD